MTTKPLSERPDAHIHIEWAQMALETHAEKEVIKDEAEENYETGWKLEWHTKVSVLLQVALDLLEEAMTEEEWAEVSAYWQEVCEEEEEDISLN